MTEALIGLGDIAWGEGIISVPTYGGGSRDIRKINLSNIPYNEAKTLGEALTEFNEALTSGDYQTISSNIVGLKAIIDNLSSLTTVKNKIDLLVSISNDLENIRQVALRVDKLDALPAIIEDTKKTQADMHYIVCKYQYIEHCIKADVARNTALVHNYLEPLTEQVIQARDELDTLLSTAVDTVTQGNEMAVKLATYTLKIVAKPYCQHPKILIDDTLQTITWQVPTVKGDCSVLTDIPTALVQSAVDDYLSTLANAGGSSADEPITVDDLEGVQ